MPQSETTKTEYKKFNPPIVFLHLWPTVMTMIVFYLLRFDIIIVLCIGLAVYGFLNFLLFLVNQATHILKD